MKFEVTRTSDWTDTSKTIEINSLDELIAFQNYERYPVILSRRSYINGEIVPTLEIYDDYRK